jgi:hypothetical protein
MSRRLFRVPTRAGQKTIDDIQQFAREHELPVPDGYIASGEGGVRLGGKVRVVEIHVTDDPKRVGKLERQVSMMGEVVREGPAAKVAPAHERRTKGRRGLVARVLASRKAIRSFL